MGFRVLRAGSCSLLVDSGRPGARHLGVAVGGAADRRSYLLGNALVGNTNGAVALEIGLAGPILEATADHHCVLSGAPFDAWCRGSPIAVGKSFQVRRGDILEVASAREGMRCYLCVAGGFEAPLVLGSRSALRPLENGTELVCPPSETNPRFVPGLFDLPRDLSRLRVLPGSWPSDDLADLRTAAFRVLPASNRMGLRLAGKTGGTWPLDLPSAPVCPGTIQATSEGQLIVLGVDGQTIGGYPRLAHVIAADLDKLAQLRPGDAITFEMTDLASAERARWESCQEIRAWTQRLLASWDGSVSR